MYLILSVSWGCTRLQVPAQETSVGLTFNLMLKNKQNSTWRRESNCQGDFSIRVFESFNAGEACSWNTLAAILQQFESARPSKERLTPRTTQQVHKGLWPWYHRNLSKNDDSERVQEQSPVWRSCESLCRRLDQFEPVRCGGHGYSGPPSHFGAAKDAKRDYVLREIFNWSKYPVFGWASSQRTKSKYSVFEWASSQRKDYVSFGWSSSKGSKGFARLLTTRN